MISDRFELLYDKKADTGFLGADGSFIPLRDALVASIFHGPVYWRFSALNRSLSSRACSFHSPRSSCERAFHALEMAFATTVVWLKTNKGSKRGRKEGRKEVERKMGPTNIGKGDPTLCRVVLIAPCDQVRQEHDRIPWTIVST